MKAVIICGGVGTKMWPESRSSSPKQFLRLIGKSHFFIELGGAKTKIFSRGNIFTD
jgi:mannose-1-phosphate guanylyltransferase